MRFPRDSVVVRPWSAGPAEDDRVEVDMREQKTAATCKSRLLSGIDNKKGGDELVQPRGRGGGGTQRLDLLLHWSLVWAEQ